MRTEGGRWGWVVQGRVMEGNGENCNCMTITKKEHWKKKVLENLPFKVLGEIPKSLNSGSNLKDSQILKFIRALLGETYMHGKTAAPSGSLLGRIPTPPRTEFLFPGVNSKTMWWVVSRPPERTIHS